MTIRVLFFATVAEIAGTQEVSLDAPAYPDVNSIFSKFARDFPALEKLRPSVLCAVNSEFAKPETPVREGDEVAFFPPVSGG